MADRGLDILPDDRPRLDRPDHLVQDAELLLPRLDHHREVLVNGHHGLDLGALLSIKRAESVFRGERDMVFAVSHLKVQGSPEIQATLFKSNTLLTSNTFRTPTLFRVRDTP